MGRRRYGTFTPARRAALRKAQLASAQKRHVGAKGFSPRTKKRLKYTAVGLGAVGVVAGGYKYRELGGAVKRAKVISEGTYLPNRRDVMRNRRTYYKGERKFKRTVRQTIRSL